jgi:hypothetical protein
MSYYLFSDFIIALNAKFSALLRKGRVMVKKNVRIYF